MSQRSLMSNVLSTLNKLIPKKKYGSLVAFFRSKSDKTMEVIIVEFDPRKFVYVNEFTNKNVKKFIDDIPKIFNNNFTAVFFQVCLFKPNGFKHNLEFCQILRDSFTALKIPTYFFSMPDYLYAHLFIATKTEIKVEEEVILLLDYPDKLNVFHCKLTKAGYKKEMIDHFVFDPKADVNVLQKNIIRSTNPKKIIFATSKPKSKNTLLFKNQILKDFVVDVFDIRRLCEFDTQFLDEMTLWILNRLHGHIARYLFMPKCARHYAVYFVSFQTTPPSPIEILSVMPSEALPLVKAAYVGRTSHPRQVCLASIDPLTNEIHIIQELDLILNKCNANKVILTVDSESFPTIKVESYILPEIFGMPNMLDETIEFKIPVIGIYGTPNFSVICYCKYDKSGYEFMESWNWIYGNELSITFHNKKPVFGAAIHELKECNPSTVVYDLIKIMAMSPENVKVEKFWDFKITKDKENPILLEFDTFDGTRKRASPAFLMAMLIRQHLKAIEAEIGERPNELGFCLFVNYSEKEKERIKNQIKESCGTYRYYDLTIALPLLQFAEKYDMKDLKKDVETHLIKESLSPENVVEILNASIISNSPILRRCCSDALLIFMRQGIHVEKRNVLDEEFSKEFLDKALSGECSFDKKICEEVEEENYDDALGW